MHTTLPELRRLTAGAIGTAALLAAPSAGHAQLTLDASWLLAEGDAVELYGSDNYADPDGNAGRAGADQTWTFATAPLIVDTTQLRVLSAAEGSAAAQFPGADLLLTGTRGLGPVGSSSELYVATRADGHYVIGVGEPDDEALVGSYALDDEILVQRSSLAFGDTYADAGGAQLVFDRSVFADQLDPTISQFIDSVRVTFDQTEASAVDGWGTLDLFGTSYEVLRVRTDVESVQTIELKGLIYPDWTDVREVPIELPEAVTASLEEGNQTGTELTWVTPAFHYPVARLFVDGEGGPSKFDYAVGATTSSTRAPAPELAFRAYRSAADALTVTFDDDAPASTLVRVYGTGGQLLHAVTLPAGQHTATLELSGATGMRLVTLWRGGRLAGMQRVL